VTAGPTREALDPARFISNPSTGKMGYALAAEAVSRGAQVILISGPTSLGPPPGANLVRVSSAEEMFRAALDQAPGADLVLKAAAVADYRPEQRARGKVKKEGLRGKSQKERGGDGAVLLRLLPTPDILEELGRRKKSGQVLVGFAAETDHLESNALRKLRKKNLDLIIANRIGREGEGFEADTNRAVVVDHRGRRVAWPLMSKEAMAGKILDLAEHLLRERTGREREETTTAREGAR
jgi:phosphopantothenoylcysteine decarboxylase / phosphopantothenate---cysteine ligase